MLTLCPISPDSLKFENFFKKKKKKSGGKSALTSEATTTLNKIFRLNHKIEINKFHLMSRIKKKKKKLELRRKNLKKQKKIL